MLYQSPMQMVATSLMKKHWTVLKRITKLFSVTLKKILTAVYGTLLELLMNVETS